MILISASYEHKAAQPFKRLKHELSPIITEPIKKENAMIQPLRDTIPVGSVLAPDFHLDERYITFLPLLFMKLVAEGEGDLVGMLGDKGANMGELFV